MKVIKRNGAEVIYNQQKIKDAVSKANAEVERTRRLSAAQITAIANNVTKSVEEYSHAVSVEDIQNMVEKEIMAMRGYEVAQKYIRYRYKRELNRKANTTDDRIMSIIGLVNEEVKQENANKNPIITSTQRDYIAGEVSKDLTRRVLLPDDIVKAHDEGIIHFHDADYYLQSIHNCDLLNLEDMLQNGTVISGTMIEKPHSFHTACNITTQIIAQVASSQYGGQSFSLAHLVPFVDISRQKIRNEIINENKQTDVKETEETIEKKTEIRLKEEIRRGIQTIQYQILTLMTTNGQAPFVTMFIWLDEVKKGKTRDDLAIIAEEVLKQRITGVKNEKGVFITPAFPKIIYVLDEDNIDENSEYFYLTELAAKCTAKRMVPDYISGKVMRKLKDGDVYTCMGCVEGKSVIRFKLNDEKYEMSFENAWDMLSKRFKVKKQPNEKDEYIETFNMKIYDCMIDDYINNYRMIRNTQNQWRKLLFETFKYENAPKGIVVTDDHPFEVISKGIVLAKDLQIGDMIYCYEDDIATLSYIKPFEKEQYSYDVTTASEHFMVNELYSHNCRSFLTVDRTTENLANAKNYVKGEHKYYGRFNQGVVTINLVDVACSSEGNMEKFWELLDNRLELCHKALQERHKRLLGTPSDVAPILWQHGALARLDKGEVIDKLLYDGYSTISLGYAGLYEMCVRMTGKSHTDPEAEPFALAVMQKMNDKCNEWKNAENIDYSLYGTPIESTTYKFAKCLQKRFGKIPGVTDKNYITNSYHIHVTENINAFDKLSFEAKFQELSPGGAISYVEVPNMQDNIPAVIAVLKHIYENIMYAELNTKSDYCQVCGYEGEISIVEDKHKKLIWQCPNCKNTNHDKMNTARRTCGYIGTNDFNQGRLGEITERVLHL